MSRRMKEFLVNADKLRMSEGAQRNSEPKSVRILRIPTFRQASIAEQNADAERRAYNIFTQSMGEDSRNPMFYGSEGRHRRQLSAGQTLTRRNLPSSLKRHLPFQKLSSNQKQSLLRRRYSLEKAVIDDIISDPVEKSAALDFLKIEFKKKISGSSKEVEDKYFHNYLDTLRKQYKTPSRRDILSPPRKEFIVDASNRGDLDKATVDIGDSQELADHMDFLQAEHYCNALEDLEKHKMKTNAKFETERAKLHETISDEENLQEHLDFLATEWKTKLDHLDMLQRNLPKPRVLFPEIVEEIEPALKEPKKMLPSASTRIAKQKSLKSPDESQLQRRLESKPSGILKTKATLSKLKPLPTDQPKVVSRNLPKMIDKTSKQSQKLPKPTQSLMRKQTKTLMQPQNVPENQKSKPQQTVLATRRHEISSNLKPRMTSPAARRIVQPTVVKTLQSRPKVKQVKMSASVLQQAPKIPQSLRSIRAHGEQISDKTTVRILKPAMVAKRKISQEVVKEFPNLKQTARISRQTIKSSEPFEKPIPKPKPIAPKVLQPVALKSKAKEKFLRASEIAKRTIKDPDELEDTLEFLKYEYQSELDYIRDLEGVKYPSRTQKSKPQSTVELTEKAVKEKRGEAELTEIAMMGKTIRRTKSLRKGEERSKEVLQSVVEEVPSEMKSFPRDIQQIPDQLRIESVRKLQPAKDFSDQPKKQQIKDKSMKDQSSLLQQEQADSIFKQLMLEEKGVVDSKQYPIEVLSLLVSTNVPKLHVNSEDIPGPSGRSIVADRIPNGKIHDLSATGKQLSLEDQEKVNPLPATQDKNIKLSDEHSGFIDSYPTETFFQARGSIPPPWFPGMFSVLPDNPIVIPLKTPSILFNRAWQQMHSDFIAV